jgi:hypothetical protein
MDQNSGLERVSAAFAPQIVMGQAAQLLINHGHKLVPRARIPAAPLAQHRGYPAMVLPHNPPSPKTY